MAGKKDKELADLGIEENDGGWYTLPNGDKVQGREAAIDAALDADGDGSESNSQDDTSDDTEAPAPETGDDLEDAPEAIAEMAENRMDYPQPAPTGGNLDKVRVNRGETNEDAGGWEPDNAPDKAKI